MSLNIQKINRLTLILSLLVLPVILLSPVNAQAEQQATSDWKPLGAGLAVGLAGIGAGIAVGVAGAAGISALTEKPEMFSNVLLIVALGEGIAIYGLIIAILLIIM